jgi:hypothetical protein
LERLPFQRRILKGENMIELNLETRNKQEEIVKDYLQNNVSETLADKINNGVKIVKENKTLINKKTLSGFFKYATEEARKQAEKGSNCACVEDKVVFGWAIHYFEEDSIEEKLFNEDGTEFKVEIKKTETPKAEKKTVNIEPPKPQNKQQSLFDLMTTNEGQEIPKIEEKVENIDKKVPKIDVFEKTKEKYVEIKDKTVDTETGEILSDEQIKNSFDKPTMYMLISMFDGKVELQ